MQFRNVKPKWKNSIRHCVFFFFLFFLCDGYSATTSNRNVEKKYFLSVSSMFKDEAPWLKEWIEYHLLVGVDHFYLYNNMSQDNYLEVLEPYIQKNIVTVIDWPDGVGEGNWVFRTQGPGFLDSCRRGALETTWLAMIDVDEFLVPVTAKSMPELLKRYRAYPGILVYWHVFGTSHLRTLPANTLLIEALHRTTRLDFPDPAKSIVRPERVIGFEWPPHKCTYRHDKQAFDAPKTEVRINHYVNRTIDFLEEKIAKKEHMESKKLSLQQRIQLMSRGNDVEDKEQIIHRYVPALREKMGYVEPTSE